jgi:hypothetical protein
MLGLKVFVSTGDVDVEVYWQGQIRNQLSRPSKVHSMSGSILTSCTNGPQKDDVPRQCCKRGAETRTRPAEHHRETPRMTEKRRDVTRNVETKREFRRKKIFAGKPRFDRARNVLPAPPMTAMI